jgi:hypothetical protein
MAAQQSFMVHGSALALYDLDPGIRRDERLQRAEGL